MICVVLRKDYLKAVRRCRPHLRQFLISKRKTSHKQVQKSKRKFQSEEQKEEILSTDQREFWKRIGKVGIGQERQSLIPLEIVNENCTLSYNVSKVLDKWKCSFEILLNQGNVDQPCLSDTSHAHYDNSGNKMQLHNVRTKQENVENI